MFRTGAASDEPISIPGLLMKTAREVSILHLLLPLRILILTLFSFSPFPLLFYEKLNVEFKYVACP